MTQEAAVSMEDSEPLAIESFSESWLLNSSYGFKNNRDEFYLSSDRFLDEAPYNFKFDIPSPHQYPPSYNLVHADDLFFNGRLKPNKYVHHPPLKNATTRPSVSLKNGSSVMKGCRKFLEKLQKSSGNIVRKCLRLLIISPLSRRVALASTARKINRVGDIRNSSNSLQRKHHHPDAAAAAYRMVDNRSTNTDDDDDDAQSPIYDAVLHCKRSIQ